MRMAFISRHKPTQSQINLAKEQDLSLEHIGDTDAFSVSPAFVYDAGPYEAVAVVHTAAAMNLCSEFVIGVFENANRADVGEPPRFEAVGLSIWDNRE